MYGRVDIYFFKYNKEGGKEGSIDYEVEDYGCRASTS